MSVLVTRTMDGTEDCQQDERRTAVVLAVLSLGQQVAGTDGHEGTTEDAEQDAQLLVWQDKYLAQSRRR